MGDIEYIKAKVDQHDRILERLGSVQEQMAVIAERQASTIEKMTEHHQSTKEEMREMKADISKNRTFVLQSSGGVIILISLVSLAGALTKLFAIGG